jgi:hypothetical protein
MASPAVVLPANKTDRKKEKIIKINIFLSLL